MRYTIDIEETMKADLMAKILTALSTGFLAQQSYAGWQEQMAPEKINQTLHGWRSKASAVVEKAWENYVDQGGLYQVRDLQGEMVSIVNPARWSSFGIMYSMTLASLVAEKGALAGRSIPEVLGQAFLQGSRYEEKFMEAASRFETACTDQDVLIASTQALMAKIVGQCVRDEHKGWREVFDKELQTIEPLVDKVMGISEGRELLDRHTGDPNSYKFRSSVTEACSLWAFKIVKDTEQQVSLDDHWLKAANQALTVAQDHAVQDINDLGSMKIVIEAYRARASRKAGGGSNENTMGPELNQKIEPVSGESYETRKSKPFGR